VRLVGIDHIAERRPGHHHTVRKFTQPHGAVVDETTFLDGVPDAAEREDTSTSERLVAIDVRSVDAVRRLLESSTDLLVSAQYATRREVHANYDVGPQQRQDAVRVTGVVCGVDLPDDLFG
jgi:hypothetical protein